MMTKPTLITLFVLLVSFTLCARAEELSLFDRLYSGDEADAAAADSSNPADWLGKDFDIHAQKPALTVETATSSSSSSSPLAERASSSSELLQGQKTSASASSSEESEGNPATAFWHVEDLESDDEDDDDDEELDEHFADGEEDLLEEGESEERLRKTRRTFSRKAVSATEANVSKETKTITGLVQSLKTAASQFPNQTNARVVAARGRWEQAIAARGKSVKAYKAALQVLRRAKTAVLKDNKNFVAALRSCQQVKAVDNKKTQLLGSLETRLAHLADLEVSQEDGVSAASLANEHSRVARLIADVAETDDEDGTDGLVDELLDLAAKNTQSSVSFADKRAKALAAIAKLRSRSGKRAQSCAARIAAARQILAGKRAEYRAQLPRVRAARAAAVALGRKTAAAKTRFTTLRAVARREKAFVDEQKGTVSALSDNIPHDADEVKARVEAVAAKLHTVVVDNVCVEKLAKCAFDVGAVTAQNSGGKRVPSSSFLKDFASCPTALKTCQSALDAAVGNA